MTWAAYYQGTGEPSGVTLPPPPPWRRFTDTTAATVFQAPPGLTDAVNASLCLRRPLLLTGAPGSGKSSVVESVAAELGLGPVLRWHVTSQSTLTDALYRYDVLGRIHAQQLGQGTDEIGDYLRLGPLGTALLSSDRPRALLIDEIDKSDLDLPSDLLDILERGRYDIPEISRLGSTAAVRPADSDVPVDLGGEVRCTEFPFIVLTSNGERDFPAPFLRRCVRYSMPLPTPEMVTRIVRAHLSEAADAPGTDALIHEFVSRVRAGEKLALDQLLSAVFVLSSPNAPSDAHRGELTQLLLKDLNRA